MASASAAPFIEAAMTISFVFTVLSGNAEAEAILVGTGKKVADIDSLAPALG